MFTSRFAKVLNLVLGQFSRYRLGDGMALAILAVLACVGLFSLTGSNRGLATILGLTCGLTGRFLGWRAGVTAAVVSTISYDILFIGAPWRLFADSEPNHYLIYLGFFAWAVLASLDVRWLPPYSGSKTGQTDRSCERDRNKLNGPANDAIGPAVSGEAAAYRLLCEARARNQTYLITGELARLGRSGDWTAYDAGLAYGLARAALAAPIEELAEPLFSPDNDADDLEADAGIVASDAQVLPLAIRHE